MTTDADKTTDPTPPPLINNWISFAGIVLAASSFFAVACLFALDYFRGSENPYVGILTYIVAPAFLVGGLVLISVGALWERRRRSRALPGVRPEPLRLDLSITRQRNAVIAVAVVTVVFLLSTAVGSYQTFHFTESVSFCGETCHTIMSPEFTAYQDSPHSRVKCVQCHIGPGADWYVKSKLSGAYQVYSAIAKKYPTPIPTPIENLRPARDTCEQCHWPQKFYGAVERTFDHYQTDEENSPWTIQMLMKVGGGDPGYGNVGGIHWHMAIANKIEYIASDRQRQVIPWVRMTDASGNVTVYESGANRLQEEEIAAAEPRVMDCIDCHNRPTHIYNAPVRSVNLAIHTGRLDRSIPSIKQQATEALTRDYETAEAASAGIAETLTAFYQTRHPDFTAANPTLINEAIAETQRIYSRSFFPEMKVTWRVYPDNIGHINFPGCYRCHDGDHQSDDGQVITNDCNDCHTLIAQGPPDQRETSLAGLEFRHPVDIDEMWKEMPCSDCHDGALVE